MNATINTKKTRKKIKGNSVLFLLLLPSVLGLVVFYIAPFIVSIYNALIDNPVAKQFVGFKNFADVLQSASFRLAVKNTAIFTGVCIPLNLVFPFLLAMVLTYAKRARNFFWIAFLLPLVIPSSSMVTLWHYLFDLNGLINSVFFKNNPLDWLNTSAALPIIVFIFLWKNIGYNVVLFFAGLNLIPAVYYECASVEGAGAWRKFWMITLPYSAPAAFLAFVMAFVNSFKSFKEIYLLSGSYPNQSIYMLQTYMYNQFNNINYQKLAASSYIVTAGFVLIVLALFWTQKKISENFS